MPNETTPGPGLNKTSLTEDAAKITPLIYRQVAFTLQVILDTQPEITGLFYFHFDSWIDPLAWSDVNLENVYFPFLTDKTKGPFTICMSDTAKQDWRGWDRHVHQNAMNAASAAILIKNREQLLLKPARPLSGHTASHVHLGRFIPEHRELSTFNSSGQSFLHERVTNVLNNG